VKSSSQQKKGRYFRNDKQENKGKKGKEEGKRLLPLLSFLRKKKVKKKAKKKGCPVVNPLRGKKRGSSRGKREGERSRSLPPSTKKEFTIT